MKTESEIKAEYAALSKQHRELLQNTRSNTSRNLMPEAWLNGEGTLFPIECMFRDLGKRPSIEYRLARLDKDLPHSRENSFWQKAEQFGRASKTVSVIGSVVSSKELSECSGFSTETINARLNRMSAESAILTPMHCRRAYPHDKAVAFLRSIGFAGAQSKDLIVNERQRYAKTAYRDLERNRESDRLDDESAMHWSDRYLRMLVSIRKMDCLNQSQKISLLAYYVMPKFVRDTTKDRLRSAIDRCNDTRGKFYRHYGGRGISVCDRWVNGFRGIPGHACLAMDIGPWQEGLELDRIDNDGNYEPENCRWTTPAINYENRFRIKYLADRLNAMVEAKVRHRLRSTRRAKGKSQGELFDAKLP